MKVLCFNNLFPPDTIGGYEIKCREVLLGLAGKGHRIRVVTAAIDGVPKSYVDGPLEVRKVFPVRHLAWPQPRENSFYPYLRRQLSHGKLADNEIMDFSPDIIYVWSLAGLASNVLRTIISAPQEKVFSFGDVWLLHFLMYWNFIDKIDYGVGESLGNRLSTGLRVPAYFPLASTLGSTESFPKNRVNVRFAQFLSHYLKNVYRNFLPEKRGWRVIYRGIDCKRFYPSGRKVNLGPKRLLYVGRLSSEKGVQTLVKALHKIRNDACWSHCTLVGRGSTLESLSLCRELRRKLVTLGYQGNECVPDIMREHDILIFPSQWGEPLGVAQIEAMGCGLPVIGSGDGGSNEVLIDGINGLKFRIADSTDLAAKITILCRDEKMLSFLAAKARQHAVEFFSSESFVESSEALLIEAFAEGSGPRRRNADL